MKHLTFLLIFVGASLFASAQTFETAGEYMNYISGFHKAVSEQMLSYVSASAHSKRESKSQKERNELIETIKNSRDKIRNMPAFEGDQSYRDAAVDFLDINYHVLKEDYEKIIDMEAIADQSFDKMEEYLNAQNAANAKMSDAMDVLVEKQKTFGAKYNINIVEGKGEVTQKLEIANEVIHYYNVVYLTFFKSYKQELYALEAVRAKDINSIEQNKNALIKTTTEGLSILDTLPSFKGDTKLKYACRQALIFYKKEAETDFTDAVDFYLKKEKFEKTKTAYDALKSSERTQENVNAYNDAVNGYNAAAKKQNANNAVSNTKRTEITNGWNKTGSDFMDKHIPKK